MSPAPEFPFATKATAGAAIERRGEERPLSITELTRDIKRLLEARFDQVRVEGEISNWRPGPSGHIYFALKDAGAVISCVLWRTTAQRLTGGGAFGDGRQVEAGGKLSLYEPRGSYQLVVEAMRPAGLGELYRRFLELKEKLQAEGLFDPARKRPLPPFPRRVGVVTSPQGAAIRDVLNVLRRRNVGLHVVIQPSRVQGVGAAAEVAEALRRLGGLRGDQAVDVILLVRGGGSIEDLWAFNEEATARAIAACPIPVISGVGHETDTTIADYAADRRAPTPSAAAELAVTSLGEMVQRLESARRGLARTMRRQIDARRLALARLVAHPAFLEPRARINSQRQRLDELTLQLERRMQQLLRAPRLRHERASAALPISMERLLAAERRRTEGATAALAPLAERSLARTQRRLQQAASMLNAMNPRRVLERGYAIVTRQHGAKEEILSDAGRAPRGKKLRIEFANGRIGAISEGPEDKGMQMGLEFGEDA